jgi:hypothetical protein
MRHEVFRVCELRLLCKKRHFSRYHRLKKRALIRLLDRDQSSRKIARMWRESRYHNKADVITTESLVGRRNVFSTSPIRGKMYRFDAVQLMKYCMIGGKFKNPYSMQELTSSELERLHERYIQQTRIDGTEHVDGIDSDTDIIGVRAAVVRRRHEERELQRTCTYLINSVKDQVNRILQSVISLTSTDPDTVSTYYVSMVTYQLPLLMADMASLCVHSVDSYHTLVAEVRRILSSNIAMLKECAVEAEPNRQSLCNTQMFLFSSLLDNFTVLQTDE